MKVLLLLRVSSILNSNTHTWCFSHHLERMIFHMAKTLADMEKKTGIVDGTEEDHKGLGWRLWLFAPLALAAIAGCAFLVVRRRFGEDKHI